MACGPHVHATPPGVGHDALTAATCRPRPATATCDRDLEGSPREVAEHALDADGEGEDRGGDGGIDDAEGGGEIDGADDLDSMKRLASVATRSL